VDELRAKALAALADTPFVAEYVFECGDRLASIITGKESPLELMFPGGSMQRAEDLYQNWAHARYFNHIVGAVVESIARANPNQTPRLLELGAGTGATTAAVLPVLAPARAVYHFTDVSDLFLDRARQKFSAYPFVRYGLLDVEKDGLAQGYGRGQFDVVLAGNVIHATRSLSETLQNVRSLLASEGVLILFEATAHQPWFDMTTGLIEGWQSFNDDIRTDSPLLSAARWEKILREEGFIDVAVFPPAGSPAEILGESVILARSLAQGISSDSASPEIEAETLPHEKTLPPASPVDDLHRRLKDCLPDERKDLLLDYVRSEVMGVLRLDLDTPPDRKARLMDLGVDSLMAVELRGRLTSGLKLGRKLPATLIFDYPTIDAVTDYLLRDVLIFEEPETPPHAAGIETLSDEKVEEMLLAKIRKMK